MEQTWDLKNQIDLTQIIPPLEQISNYAYLKN